MDGGIVILASWEHHFIGVHENVEQHPNDSILKVKREGGSSLAKQRQKDSLCCFNNKMC